MIGSASAPASSGNLGPGFDVIALALELRCVATAEMSDTMTLTEQGSTVRLDPGNMIYRAVHAAVERPMHITLNNEVPRARGLGSSSAVAAAVAGASIKGVGAQEDVAAVFQIVTELEGHADNAAAAVFGGLVAATDTGIQRLELHESLRPIVAIPTNHLRTDEARAALPPTAALDVVSRSLARLAFLIEGLRLGNASTLAHAGGDEIHETPRASLSPITGELIAAAMAAGALHASWSGAGPSAIAFATEETSGRVIGAMGGVLGSDGEVLALAVDHDGLL